LRLLRPDLVIEPVRGNVDTRLRKLKEGQYDAILLAAAGLRRLGLEKEIAQILTPDQMCPAPGQGALAIQTRSQDAACTICRDLDHLPTYQSVTCERAALTALGGGCQLPFGAFAEHVGSALRLTAVVIAADASQHLRATAEGSPELSEQLGLRVAQDLLTRGAAQILGDA
jgi:hydroxymethylbilane synthase